MSFTKSRPPKPASRPESEANRVETGHSGEKKPTDLMVFPPPGKQEPTQEKISDRVSGPDHAKPLANVEVTFVGRDEDYFGSIAKIARRAGAQLHFERSPSASLEAARKFSPDILVCDAEMEGMDVLSFLRATSLDPVLHEIPVVLVSSSADVARWMRNMHVEVRASLLRDAKAQEVLDAFASILKAYSDLRDRLSKEKEVRGTLAHIGTQTFLRLVAGAGIHALVTIQESCSLFEVQVEKARLRKLTQTSKNGYFARGRSVLVPLVGCRSGDFVVKRIESGSGSASDDMGMSLHEALREGTRLLGAMLDVVTGAGLLRAARISTHAELLDSVLAHSPPAVRPIGEQISQGYSPRDMILDGGVDPVNLEAALVELACRGAFRGVYGPMGEDRYAASLGARSKERSSPQAPRPGVSTLRPEDDWMRHRELYGDNTRRERTTDPNLGGGGLGMIRRPVKSEPPQLAPELAKQERREEDAEHDNAVTLRPAPPDTGLPRNDGKLRHDSPSAHEPLSGKGLGQAKRPDAARISKPAPGISHHSRTEHSQVSLMEIDPPDAVGSEEREITNPALTIPVGKPDPKQMGPAAKAPKSPVRKPSKISTTLKPNTLQNSKEASDTSAKQSISPPAPEENLSGEKDRETTRSFLIPEQVGEEADGTTNRHLNTLSTKDNKSSNPTASVVTSLSDPVAAELASSGTRSSKPSSSVQVESPEELQASVMEEVPFADSAMLEDAGEDLEDAGEDEDTGEFGPGDVTLERDSRDSVTSERTAPRALRPGVSDEVTSRTALSRFASGKEQRPSWLWGVLVATVFTVLGFGGWRLIEKIALKNYGKAPENSAKVDDTPIPKAKSAAQKAKTKDSEKKLPAKTSRPLPTSSPVEQASPVETEPPVSELRERIRVAKQQEGIASDAKVRVRRNEGLVRVNAPEDQKVRVRVGDGEWFRAPLDLALEQGRHELAIEGPGGRSYRYVYVRPKQTYVLAATQP